MKKRETARIRGGGRAAKQLQARERRHMREHNRLERDKRRFRKARRR